MVVGGGVVRGGMSCVWCCGMGALSTVWGEGCCRGVWGGWRPAMQFRWVVGVV